MNAKKATKEYNLAVIRPDLAKEWNYEKNGDLKPEDMCPNSTKRVWWKCKNGHEWEMTAHGRKTGNGCPYCSNKKICDDNSLAMCNPKLAKQWHPTKNGNLTPFDIAPCSGMKVYWLCEKGHEWESYVFNRARGVGCPYCSNKKICDDNNLVMYNPKMAKQWHPTKNGNLTPFDVAPCSGMKVYWLCEKGHEWETSINDRNRGNGCPKCTRRISRPCVKWLNEQNIEKREKYIIINERKFYVDGFKENVIFEFLGDYWHGNPVKFNPNDVHPVIKKSFGELLYKTINKLNYLYNNNYKIVYRWESIEQNFTYKYINKNKDFILKFSKDFFNNNRKDNILVALEG